MVKHLGTLVEPNKNKGDFSSDRMGNNDIYSLSRRYPVNK